MISEVYFTSQTMYVGHLMYLENLGRSQEHAESGHNPQPCPICQNEMGRGWAVLLCGHSFCLQCIEVGTATINLPAPERLN